MDSWARSKVQSQIMGAGFTPALREIQNQRIERWVAGELFNWKIVRPLRQLLISQYFIDKFNKRRSL